MAVQVKAIDIDAGRAIVAVCKKARKTLRIALFDRALAVPAAGRRSLDRRLSLLGVAPVALRD